MNELMMTNQVRSKCINEAFKAILDHPKDVTIVSAENQIVYVNRLLLSLFSSTLSPLLSSTICSPSSIILPDCSIYSIKQLFEILHKGYTSMNKDDGTKIIETASLMGISIDKLNENNGKGQLSNEKANNADKNTPFNVLKKRYKSGPEKRKVEVIGSHNSLKKRNKSGPERRKVDASSCENKKLKSDELNNPVLENSGHKNPQQTQQKRQITPPPKQQIQPQPKHQIPPQPKQQIQHNPKQQIPPQPKQQIPPHQKQQVHPKQQTPPQLKQQISLQEKKHSKDNVKETQELSLPLTAQKESVLKTKDIIDEVCLTIKDEPIEVDDALIDVIDIPVKTTETCGDIQNNEKNNSVELYITNEDIPDTSSAVQIIDARHVTPILVEVPNTIINKDVLNEVFSSIKDESVGMHKDIRNRTPNSGLGDAVYKTPDELYLCQICSKDISKNRLREHYSRHFTNEMKKFEKLTTKENECLICNKRFATKQSSLRHIGMAHEKLDEFLVEKGLVPILNKNESKRIKRKEKSKVTILNEVGEPALKKEVNVLCESTNANNECSTEKELTGVPENLEEILDEIKIPSNNQVTTETPALQKASKKQNTSVINEENIPMEIDENLIKIEPVDLNDTPNIEETIPEEDPKTKTKDILQTKINSDILDKVCSFIKDEPAAVDNPNIETNSPQTTINKEILDSVCSAIKDEPTVIDDSPNNENNIPMESGNSKTVIDKDTLDTVCSTIKDELLDIYTEENTIKKNLERLESCQISVKDCLNLVKENQCIYCKKIFFHKKILRRHIGMAHKKDDDKKNDETISEKGVLPINKRFANTRVDKGRTNGLNKRKMILQGSKLPSKQRHSRYEKKRA